MSRYDDPPHEFRHLPRFTKIVRRLVFTGAMYKALFVMPHKGQYNGWEELRQNRRNWSRSYRKRKAKKKT